MPWQLCRSIPPHAVQLGFCFTPTLQTLQHFATRSIPALHLPRHFVMPCGVDLLQHSGAFQGAFS